MKIIEIEQCHDCPNIVHRAETCSVFREYQDDHGGRPIPDCKNIPEWCPLDTPEEYVESNFNIDKEPSCAIKWGIADFEHRARVKENEYYTTDFDFYDGDVTIPINLRLYDRDKFPEALDKMERKHDAEIGIAWDTIDIYLDEYCKNK